MKKLLVSVLALALAVLPAVASPLSVTIDRTANSGQGPYPVCANPLSSSKSTCASIGTMTKDGKFSPLLDNVKTYILGLFQQNFTLQVPSAAALRTTAVFTGVLAHRGGAFVPGDGGAADYAGNATACPAPLGDDGGSCLNAPGGSWRVDAATRLTPFVFLAKGNSNGTSGNGNDDTTALQNWLNYGMTGSGVKLYLPGRPQGQLYRTTAPLTASFGLRIDGDYCSPGPNGGTGWVPGPGSTFFFDHSGRGINFNGGESTLRDVCTYRAQPDPAGVSTAYTGGATTNGNTTITVSSTSGMRQADPITGSGIQANSVIRSISNSTTLVLNLPATATASGLTFTTKSFTPGSFDWDISVNGADLDLIHSVVVNPTNGIYLGTGRLWINGLKGRPLSNGVYAYDSLDTDKWNDIHWWPFAGLASDGSISAVLGWQLNNLKAFLINRMDDSQLSNISVYGAAYCFYFAANPVSAGPTVQGSSALFNVSNALCDAMGNGAGIYVDSSVGTTNGFLTASFINFVTQANNGPGNIGYNTSAVDIEGAASRLSFSTGFYSGFSTNAAFIVNGAGNRITLPDARFYGWGVSSAGTAPAIFASQGNQISYGDQLPYFDNTSGVQVGPGYGGTLYTLANAPAAPIPFIGNASGMVMVEDIGSHAVASFLLGGGAVTATQAGTEFQALSAGTDSSVVSGTTSGKIGVGFSSTQGTYVIYNKTGAAVNYWFQPILPVAAP